MEQKFINKIEELYKKYNNDVQSLREEQRPLSFGDEKLEYRKYDDLEAEILYMLVKEYKPSIIKELGCAGGWSCSWMLQALKEIGFNRDVKKLVYLQAKLANKAKLDAIVCSAQEVKIIRKVFK